MPINPLSYDLTAILSLDQPDRDEARYQGGQVVWYGVVLREVSCTTQPSNLSLAVHSS